MAEERFVVCHTGDLPPERVRTALGWEGVEFVPLAGAGGALAALRPSGYLVNGPDWHPPYLSAELIDAAGSLEIVTYMGATLAVEDYAAFFDFDALRERRIVVTTTPGATISVAEGAIALLAALNLDLLPANDARKAGNPSPVEQRQSLHGSTLGIVGMGQIGRRVARLAAALGMRIAYFSRQRHLDVEDELPARFLGLDELFARSEHVSVHSSHSLTRGLIERDALAHASGVNLVNTADPAIVDPEALLEALEAGWIRRAAIEGRYPEPHDERFRHLPDDRVIMLPFMSWNTALTHDRAWDAYLESMLAYSQGRPVPYRIT